jgi:hypothetical protein
VRALLVVLAALALGACTMLTSFDPEGRPCDLAATPAMQCLSGYHCADGKCVKGSLDGGP